MKVTLLIVSSAVLLLAAGCQTTEPEPVSWRRQAAYLANTRDPRIYGFSIYQTPAGVEYRGSGRLHPTQVEKLLLESKKPDRPVVMLRGNFGQEWPVLFDMTATATWLDLDVAQRLGAMPIGENGKARLVKRSGEDIANCLSVVQSLRFGQLYIESPLVYVRLADGPFGSLARGIDSPDIKGVIGWDLLKKFEQILFDYKDEQILLFTGETYTPDPERLIAQLPLVKHAGACAVHANIDGETRLVLIDPAGDFEVAADNAGPVAGISLGQDLYIQHPAVVDSPGGLRIGARFLQNYTVIICPQPGLIFFEKQ